VIVIDGLVKSRAECICHLDHMQRIVGKLQEIGMGKEAQQYVLTEMTKPLDTQALLAAAKGQPVLAAQIYAASLLAIEVDTPAEKNISANWRPGWVLNPR
jgi:uncharacterized membrane protein YebE (DUF533 family)